MALHVYKVGADTDVVFGIEWRVVTDVAEERDEVNAFVDEADAALQVRHEANSTVVYGFVSKDDFGARGKNIKFVSAAVLLATFPDVATNAMFVEVTGQKAKLAVIENGVPAPGGDIVASIQDVEAAIDQISVDTGKIFTIYGNCVDLYPQAIPVTLEELVAEANVAAATMARVKGRVPVKLLLLMAVVLLGTAGSFYYSHVKDERARMAMMARRKPTVSPEIAYKASLNAALQSAGVVSPDAWRVLAKQWVKEDPVQGGWLLSLIDCVPETCTYTWRRVGGNNESLRDDLGPKPYRYSADGNAASYTLAVAQKSTTLLDPLAMAGMAQFQLQTGSYLQDLKTAGLQVMDLGKPAVFGAPPSINVNLLHHPVLSGTLGIVGPVAVLHDVFAEFPDPNAVSFNHLVIKFEKLRDPIFKLEGSYYVKG